MGEGMKTNCFAAEITRMMVPMMRASFPLRRAIDLGCACSIVLSLLAPQGVLAAVYGMGTYTGYYGGCTSDDVSTIGVKKGITVKTLALLGCAQLQQSTLYFLRTSPSQTSKALEEAVRMASNDGKFYLYQYSDNTATWEREHPGQFLADHFGASQAAKADPVLWPSLQTFAQTNGYTWKNVGGAPVDIGLAADQLYLLVVVGDGNMVSK